MNHNGNISKDLLPFFVRFICKFLTNVLPLHKINQLMSFKVYDDSVNYTAQVIKLPAKKTIAGLDNLVSVTVFGNDCLVSKDAPEDQLYVFFPSGSRLSEAFLKGNNMYREQQLNADVNQKGFFDVNGRVKAIKFKGVISSGLVTSVDNLINLWTEGIDKDWACGVVAQLRVGDSFNELDGVEVCRKYFVPTGMYAQIGKGNKQSKINNRLTDLLVPNQFRFHSDTAHFANNIHQFEPGDVIVITDKWHGSSCILSKVLITKRLNLWQKFVNLLGGQIPAKQYGYVYSSGKPKSNLPKGIEGEWINDGPDYYVSNIWKRAFDHYKEFVEDGISLYGELVGFTEGGSAIQAGYDYGCDPQMYRFVIYRITYTKPDGNVIEFSWQQIKDYCAKYKLETVPEIFFGSISQWGANETKEFWRDEILMTFQNSQYLNMEGYCVYSKNKVPAEGVVIRIDGRESFKAFKLKSKLFLKKESDDLDKDIVSIEETA